MPEAAGPAVARLHLHRGYGAMYTVISVVLLGIVVASLVDNLQAGKLALALVTIVVGLALAAYLGKVGLELLVPNLVVDADGVRGRMSPWGGHLDAEWADVTIDVDRDRGRNKSPDVLPGRFRLADGSESVTVYSRSWFGFRDFVLVVASTPAASRRLTPEAEQEMVRLLGIRPADQGPVDG